MAQSPNLVGIGGQVYPVFADPATDCRIVVVPIRKVGGAPWELEDVVVRVPYGASDAEVRELVGTEVGRRMRERAAQERVAGEDWPAEGGWPPSECLPVGDPLC